MNYLTAAENVLEKYMLMEQSVKNIEKELVYIRNKMLPSDRTVGRLELSGVRGSRTDDNNELFRYAELKATKEETQEYLDRIDAALDGICLEKKGGHYKEILLQWYVEKKIKEDITINGEYPNKKTLYLQRDKALEAFAVALYGIRATLAT